MDYKHLLEELKKNNQNRTLLTIEQREGKYIFCNNQKFLDLSSNDYLSIGSNNILKEKFLSEKNSSLPSLSSSSSRLITGNFCEHEKLETILAEYYKNKKCLLLDSGYHANLGIIPTLINKKCIIFADKQVHASIIDGIKLSGATFHRYFHNNMEHLEELLQKHREKYEDAWVISESIFSMDGDTANIEKLVALKEKYKLYLYIDEAHAFGVRGAYGAGVCQEKNLDHHFDIIVGTFGKAIGSVGAFVACNQVFKDYLINKCRSLIYSTSLPPINALWTSWLLENIVPNMHKERKKLSETANNFRKTLLELKYTVIGDSQIIPLIIGNNKETMQLSKKLKKANILALPIRPPSVPINKSRIRFSLNSSHTSDDIKILTEALRDIKERQ
jgi:8-amino-7-oxononanoate synthase